MGFYMDGGIFQLDGTKVEGKGGCSRVVSSGLLLR